MTRKQRYVRHGSAVLETIHARVTPEQRHELERLADLYYAENTSYLFRKVLDLALPLIRAEHEGGSDGRS